MTLVFPSPDQSRVTMMSSTSHRLRVQAECRAGNEVTGRSTLTFTVGATRGSIQVGSSEGQPLTDRESYDQINGDVPPYLRFH